MPLNRHQGKHINSGFVLLKRALTHFNFLARHTRVLVGVSGGVDSLVLLHLLLEYDRRYQRHWEIHACHINPQFPGWQSTTLHHLFEGLSIPYHIVRKNIHTKIKDAGNKCYRCSRERRKALLETASGLNIFQVALAHHKQDVAETVIMNMIYNGQFSTLTPRQSVIHGRFYFVRPLYYFEKDTIRAMARSYGLPANDNICPFYQDSKREVVRNFLERTKENSPDIYKNIFRSLSHINKAYLP